MISFLHNTKIENLTKEDVCDFLSAAVKEAIFLFVFLFLWDLKRPKL